LLQLYLLRGQSLENLIDSHVETLITRYSISSSENELKLNYDEVEFKKISGRTPRFKGTGKEGEAGREHFAPPGMEPWLRH
jgi:hypothetical protein